MTRRHDDQPGWADRLLGWLLPDDWRETFVGDVEEERRERLATGRPTRAWYWRQVARLLVARLWRADTARGAPSMRQTLRDDCRAAWRHLRRQKRYALLVTLTLGTSLGSAAAVLGLVRGYLLTPLPYPEAGRLATVNVFTRDVPMPRHLASMDWTGAGEVADLVVSWDIDGFTVLGDDRPRPATGRWISADIFPWLGVTPALGRTFTEAEEDAGVPVAVIGHRFWQTHFGAAPDVLGRPLTVRSLDRPDRAATFTIVGVMPPRFWHLEEHTDLLLPLGGTRPPSLIRLRPGVSATVAAERLTTLVRDAGPGVDPAWRTTVRLAGESHVEPIRDLLTSIALAVTLLVFVGGGNLVFLQMARGLARRRELAVRTAIGAGRGRLIRQLVLEQTMLASGAVVVAWGLAVALGSGVLPAVEGYLGRLLPGTTGSGPDLMTVAAMAAFATVACVASGLTPLMAAPAQLATAVLGGTGHTMSRRRAIARQAIVALQVAATFALVAGAALVVRSAWHLGRVDVGFEPDRVLSGSVTLHPQSYPDVSQRRAAVERILQEVGRLPGVETVGMLGGWPFQWSPGTPVRATNATEGLTPAVASRYSVSEGYFGALGIPIVEGRGLKAADRDGPVHAAVVSESLARRLWPGRSATGQTLEMGTPPAGTMVAPARQPTAAVLTVVGVAGDVARSLTEERVPEVYVPLERGPGSFLFLQVRSSGDVMALRPGIERTLSSIDPALVFDDVRTMAELVTAAGVQPRFLSMVLASFAALAGVVAMVGVYAVSAWIARQRRREAALRLALGATPSEVTRLFVQGGVPVVAAGLAAGIGPALWLGRLLEPYLHGISSGDVWTHAAVAAVIAGVGVAAVWWPARRAGGADPVAVLRAD